MKSVTIFALSTLVALSLCTHPAFSCEWARGYFHQVTALRGKVVGVNKGDVRHTVRRLRQSVEQSGVELSLFEYRSEPKSRSEMPFVASVVTDAKGRFDFGTVKKGHYTLIITTPWDGEDWHDVQVTELPVKTESVIIDISPVYPNCQGGHEFIVHGPDKP